MCCPLTTDKMIEKFVSTVFKWWGGTASRIGLCGIQFLRWKKYVKDDIVLFVSTGNIIAAMGMFVWFLTRFASEQF